MRRNLRQRIRTFTFLVALTTAFAAGSEAMACPNCKFANETEDSRPRAYMYSILFMIGMPATIFTGFGISFYRLTKKAQLAAESQANSDDAEDDS